MQISQWDKLPDQQRNDFTIVLIGGAITNLKANGQANQVATLMDLFFNKDPKIATGSQEFLNNIEFVRNVNTTLSDAKKLEVESAFRATLKSHGIDIPYQDLLDIGKTYVVPSPTH